MININDLISFINEANSAGYEQDKPLNLKKETNGSTTIYYQKNDWEFHDNFFGGEPYGGRNVIHYKNKPVHITVYYGNVDQSLDPNQIYPFLRTALRAGKEKAFRGPNSYSENNFAYKRELKGTIKEFHLEEKIFLNKKLVYKAVFIGGLVDQRQGD